jgi:hypothetical protein
MNVANTSLSDPVTIVLRRDSGYADRLRKYRVILDDLEIGRIGNGDEKRFDITPGEHRLMIKVDWGRSGVVRFIAVEGQMLEFECGSNLRGANLLFAIYYATFGFRNYLWLRVR